MAGSVCAPVDVRGTSERHWYCGPREFSQQVVDDGWRSGHLVESVAPPMTSRPRSQAVDGGLQGGSARHSWGDVPCQKRSRDGHTTLSCCVDRGWYDPLLRPAHLSMSKSKGDVSSVVATPGVAVLQHRCTCVCARANRDVVRPVDEPQGLVVSNSASAHLSRAPVARPPSRRRDFR